MSTFQPSKFSTPSASTPSARQNKSAKVEDIQGTEFLLHSDGSVVLVSTGKIWTSGDGDTYWGIIRNLANDVKSNAEVIASVMGQEVLDRAKGTSPKQLPAKQLPAQIGPGAADIPFYKQPWFWPVVLLGVASTAGVAYVYWPRGEEEEEEEEEEPEYIPPPPPAPSATTRRSRASIARAEVKAKKALPPPPPLQEVEEGVENEPVPAQ